MSCAPYEHLSTLNNLKIRLTRPRYYDSCYISAVLSRLQSDKELYTLQAPSLDIYILLDSGCACQAIISPKIIRSLNLTELPLEHNITLELADGSSSNQTVEKYVRVVLKVAGLTQVIRPLVAEISEDLILGLVWLKFNKVILDFHSGTMSFDVSPEEAGDSSWPEYRAVDIRRQHILQEGSTAMNSLFPSGSQNDRSEFGDVRRKSVLFEETEVGRSPRVAASETVSNDADLDFMLEDLSRILFHGGAVNQNYEFQEISEEKLHVGQIVLNHEIAPSGIPLTDEGIPFQLSEFADVFVKSQVKSVTIPPRRPGIDMEINLDPTKPLPEPAKAYRLSNENEAVRQAYVQSALKNQWIRESNSPVAAGFFVVEQANGKKRSCGDYRALNAITLKDRFPMPSIDEMLDELEGSILFTQLDMPDAYHQLRIREGDEWKTAFRTADGLYEYQVVCFGLTNAPSVFQRFIRSLLKGENLTVRWNSYLDNIIVYYKDKSGDKHVTPDILEEHLKHVAMVLQIMRDNNLTLRAKKCTFAASWVDFLGFILSTNGMKMQPEKVKAVLDWSKPRTLKELQSFLGFTNFYRRFIKDYAGITKPLTACTKTRKKFELTQDAEQSFNKLKTLFTSAPVLSQFNYTRQTRIETDCSDWALGSVVNQLQSDNEYHPIFYRSRQLADAELNYEVHDKELLAIIDTLRTHRSNLLSLDKPFVICCDHKNLKYFLTKKELTARQMRWAILMADFDFTIEFIPGKDNVAADALSRRDYVSRQDATISRTRQMFRVANNDLKFNLPEVKSLIPGDLEEFPLVMHHNETLNSRVVPHMLAVRQVSLDITDKEQIFRRAHDDPFTGGHLGFRKTLDKLKRRNHHWIGINGELRRYIGNCQKCIQAKARRHKPYGLLHPLPVPLQPWDEVSMDFITSLPLSEGYDTILVIKDRYTKMVHFIPVKATISSKDLAQIALENWIKLHGIPTHITSDRDKLFIHGFWHDLCRLLRIEQRLSSAYHPQTDGSSEVVNQMIEQYIRIYGNYAQNDWSKWLPLCEFTYNNSVNASTKVTPFWACYSYHPRDINLKEVKSSDIARKDVEDLSKSVQELHNHLRETLFETQNQYSIQANKRRIAAPQFEIGSNVYLNRKNIKTLRPKFKFDSRFLGPFEVIEKIGNDAYRLRLPSQWKIHNVFHVSLLEPGQTNPYPSQRLPETPQPEVIEGLEEYEIESIRDHRIHYGKLQYLVHWLDTLDAQNTWEDSPSIKIHGQESIDEYWATQGLQEPTKITQVPKSLHRTRKKRKSQDKRGGDVRNL